MRKLLLLCCVVIWSCSLSHAQDEHFTQYQYAPTFFNPANTGNFYGSYRAGILYRDQSRSWFTGGKAYQTPSLFVDANFNLALRKQDWTALGITVIGDKSGSLGLQSIGYAMNAAYHFSLDKKRKNVMTLGVQYGQVSMGIDDNYYTETLIKGGNVDPLNLQDFSASYSDLNVGVLFVSKPDKSSKIEIGASLGHLLSGEFNIQGDSMKTIQDNEIDTRINAHAKYRFLAGKKLALEPVVYFSGQAGVTNVQTQLNSAYLLNADKELALTAGLGYRLGDAAQIMVGANYGLWSVGVAYDWTVSDASQANNGFGALEIGVSRIFYRFKRPKINPILICPRL